MQLSLNKKCHRNTTIFSHIYYVMTVKNVVLLNIISYIINAHIVRVIILKCWKRKNYHPRKSCLKKKTVVLQVMITIPLQSDHHPTILVLFPIIIIELVLVVVLVYLLIPLQVEVEQVVLVPKLDNQELWKLLL